MSRDAEILAARAQGQTYAEIAAAFGLTRQRVCQICRRPADAPRRHAWTAQDDETLRALWAAGTPTQSIAVQFGVSRGSIQQRVGILGLPLRRLPLTTREVAVALSSPAPAHRVAAELGRCAATVRKIRRLRAK